MIRVGKRKYVAIYVLSFLAAVLACLFTGKNMQAHAAQGVNVQYRTQDEIRTYIRNNGATTSSNLTFVRNPYFQTPFEPGALSYDTQQSAANMVNQMRYIAGLSNMVSISDSYSQYAQAAAFINYLNGSLSKTPARPAGISDQLYQLASVGAERSNLAWSSWANRGLNETIVSDWMNDGDTTNIYTLEHRRRLLYPLATQIGFGAVSGTSGTYSCAYTYESNYAWSNETGVAWPAQNMPVEYFSTLHPWSISLGHQVNANDISVVLTRLSDNKRWYFSRGSSDGEFWVSNDNYGQTGCIIFRPSIQTIGSYQSGDTFMVTVNGDTTPIQYTVQFFSLGSYDPSKRMFTVTFDSQGGNSILPITVEEQGVISSLPTPTMAGAEFLGWFTGKNGDGVQLTNTTRISRNMTYYAYWKRDKTLTGITAFYNGTAVAGTDVSNGMVVGARYSDGSSQRVYDFTVSQKTLTEGKNTITVSYGGYTQTVTVTASKLDTASQYYEFAFNANGGNNTGRSKIIIKAGEAIGVLPVAERENYLFNGWYTQATGGQKVFALTVPNESATLYAQWSSAKKPGKVNTPTLKSSQSGQLKISYAKVSGAAGYDIAYSTDRYFSDDATNKMLVTSTAKTLKDLKEGKKYFVKVRAYRLDSTGKKIYGAYSQSKGMRIKE
ncbi:MAG: hypothetical protein HFH29_04860 [Eubacterium sp.]|nr:hypothetical protein [Eubacterium sp.]